MKRKPFLLLKITILSLLPIMILLGFYFYKLDRISYDFERNIFYGIQNMKRFDLKYNSYYIAGQDEQYLYLGNSTAIRHLLKIDPLLRDTQVVWINLDKKYYTTEGNYNIYVDSSVFYLFNGTSRLIFNGRTTNWKANLSQISVPYYQQCVPLNNHSFAFKCVSSRTKMNSLRKESISERTIQNDEILEKQVDGLFCTSGIFDYNKELKIFTYIFHFRNEILLIDTNLKLIKKMQTIDPIDSARFTVSEIKSDNSKVLTSPSITVNALCATWKKYLFVKSELMGKHEDEIRFKASTVIDIYDLVKQRYLYSLYLPLQNKEQITQFKILNDCIYTMADHYISRYEVKLPDS